MMKTINNIVHQMGLIEKTGKLFRIILRNHIERKQLTNSDFSILSNNCIGGTISHDLGMKFLSPTVNLFIRPNDFVKFLENLEQYLQCDVVEIDSKLTYPVGKLDDIIIYFKHYKTFEEAKRKWNDRKQRIRYDNLFIIMTDRWCCPDTVLRRFQKLPYKNKVCFTVKNYPAIPCCHEVKKDNDGSCVGVITKIENMWGKRLYQYAENFDYVAWLNSGKTNN